MSGNEGGGQMEDDQQNVQNPQQQQQPQLDPQQMAIQAALEQQASMFNQNFNQALQARMQEQAELAIANAPNDFGMPAQQPGNSIRVAVRESVTKPQEFQGQKEAYDRLKTIPLLKDIPGLGISKTNQKKTSLRRLHETAYNYISNNRANQNIPAFTLINSGSTLALPGTFAATLNKYLSQRTANPDGLKYIGVQDQTIGFVLIAAFRVNQNGTIGISVKAKKGNFIVFNAVDPINMDSAKLLVMSDKRPDAVEFLSRKKYIGYLNNYDKRIYRVFKAAYNILLQQKDVNTSSIGAIKIAINVLRKICKSNQAYAYKDGTKLRNILTYGSEANADNTGKGVVIRRFIKATGRTTAMAETVKDDAMKRLQKKYQNRLDANKRRQAAGENDNQAKNLLGNVNVIQKQ